MKLHLIPALFSFICVSGCQSHSNNHNPLASNGGGADMTSGGSGGNGTGGGVDTGGGGGGGGGNDDRDAASGGDVDAAAALGDAGSSTNGGGSAPPSPFIDTAGAIHVFATFDYKMKTAQITQAAPHIDFVWGSGSAAAWHAANPKTYVTYYIPFNQDPTNQPLSWWQANHPDWVLYKCDRTTPATASGYPNIDLDVTNPAVRAWQLSKIKAGAQGYDGVAFDLYSIDNAHHGCGVYRNGQWVQLYSGSWTDPAFANGMLAWLHAMYTDLHALPKPLGVVPNFTLARTASDATTQQILANVDAILDEDTWGNWGGYTTGGTWVERVRFIEKMQAAGKAYYQISAYATLDNAAVQWSLASYLMSKEHFAAVDFGDNKGLNFGSDPWRAEYGAAVGAACGPMTAAQNVYTRSFQHGLAIVNPSASTTATFALPSAAAYRDAYGNAVSGTVTLPPHSGMVLLLTGAPRC